MVTKKKTAKRGQELMADLEQYGKGQVQEIAFWMGVVPQFPVPYVHCAGFTFSKLNEELIPDPSDRNSIQRVPVVGALHKHVTADMIEELKSKISRLVVRFRDPPTDEDLEVPKGQTVAMVSNVQPRRGFLITIPTKEELEEARKGGYPMQPYVRQKWDEPAARYMFMQPCVDQDNPQRGGQYPDTLDMTNIDISVFDEMNNLLD